MSRGAVSETGWGLRLQRAGGAAWARVFTPTVNTKLAVVRDVGGGSDTLHVVVASAAIETETR